MGPLCQCIAGLPAFFWPDPVIFVIPMAGRSRRFHDAGYSVPKYQLILHGRPVFDHAVRSFAAYFDVHRFLFVVRAHELEFVRTRCAMVGIFDPIIVRVERDTSGQAETVLLGLDASAIGEDESLTIFNIDTFRPDYSLPSLKCDGFIEVFRGEGRNWSFVAPDPSRPFSVSETAEKLPISNLCCTGIYQFARASDFRWAYEHPLPPKSEAERQERFVAPLYNGLVARGLDIRYGVIARNDAIFCGTPEEYQHCRNSAEIGLRLSRLP